jgi:hypothetical protein
MTAGENSSCLAGHSVTTEHHNSKADSRPLASCRVMDSLCLKGSSASTVKQKLGCDFILQYAVVIVFVIYHLHFHKK